MLFYAAVALSLLEAMLKGRLQRNWPYMLTVQVLFGGEMAAMGIWAGEEWRWWVIDASMFGGLIGGVIWMQQRDGAAVARVFARCGTLATAVLAFNVIGLLTGFVTPSSDDDRLYSSGLFAAGQFIPLVFPFWFTSARRGRTGWSARVETLLPYAGIAVTLAAAIVSATRSMLLLWLGSVLLTYWVTSRSRAVSLAVVAIVAVAAFGGFLGDGSQLTEQNLLFDRLSQTLLSEESRAQEVEMMFDDLQTPADYWLGKGFGSRFWSIVGEDGGGLAFAPHVAILTSWYKAGLIGFLAIIVWPVGLAAWRLFSMDANLQRRSAAAGILAYVVLASMSGGWNYLMLFPVGVFLAIVTRRSESS